MTKYRDKHVCPFCESKNVFFRGELGSCYGCHKKFVKSEAKVIQIEMKVPLPPTLRKIAKARNGEIVNLKACPSCGSLSISYKSRNGKGYCHCGHCKQVIKKEDLILYGEKPVLKIDRKREVIQ